MQYWQQHTERRQKSRKLKRLATPDTSQHVALQGMNGLMATVVDIDHTHNAIIVGLHPDKVSGPMVMGFLLITYVALHFTILFLISVVDYTSRFGRLLS